MAFSFPVSFKEFASDPVKAILFLSLCAIMYLYIDNKLVYNKMIDDQYIRIEKLEGQVKTLNSKVENLNVKLLEFYSEHINHDE